MKRNLRIVFLFCMVIFLAACGGKNKEESELSELEKAHLEIERLKRQIELKDREVIILKKLKEVERRRYSPKANKNRNT